MKKNLLWVWALVGVLMFGCKSDEVDDHIDDDHDHMEVDSPAAKNLETMKTINKAFETGDFAAVRALIADDAVDHAGPTGDIVGGDSIVAMMQQWSSMVANMKTDVKKEFADKEYVIQWAASSGTMLVDGFGMKKGQTYSSDAVEIVRFNSMNQAVEHWTFMNYTEMMKMMGGNELAKESGGGGGVGNGK